MGGNVFKGKTKPIPKELIDPTLRNYFEELRRILGITLEWIPLGSTGKKPFSNDIDLGFDQRQFLPYDSWGLQGLDEEYNVLKKRARTSTHEQLQSKAFLRCLARHINNNSTIICDMTQINPGSMFTLFPQAGTGGDWVQIDWMLGDLEWLKFSYYSQVEDDSLVKGLHRTQLILATLSVLGYSFKHIDGVRDRLGNTVASTPAEVVDLLSSELGISLEEADLNTFGRLNDLLKTNEQYDAIINKFLKIMDSTRVDIPMILHKRWIANKEALNLRGAFLPETSILQAYK